MRIDPRTRRRTSAAVMLTALLVAATALLGGPALAEESDRQPAEITKEATYYAPRGEVLPDTLVSEFPPGVVCVVRPELCPDGLEPVFEPVEDGLTGALAAEEDNQPTQPGPGASNPETLPVSATGGRADYRSAFQIELPDVPDGHQVDEFTLHMTVGQPTYAQGSPGFRQAVLAAFTCVRDCQDDQFAKIAETDLADTDVLELEICPIVTDAEWTGERGQPDAAMPAADCIVGQNGVYADGNGEVSFDLTLFLSDLASSGGTFNGFLLRPAGLPNLASGDADVTYNKMVSLDRAGITTTLATSETPPTPSFDFGGAGGSLSSDTGGSAGGFSSPPATDSGDVFAAPVDSDPEPGAPSPEVASAAPATESGAPLVAEPVASGPVGEAGSAWYVWLLVPVFGAGAYLTAQTLTAAPIVAEAAGRSGALTRLLEKRAASGAAPPEFVTS